MWPSKTASSHRLLPNDGANLNTYRMNAEKFNVVGRVSQKHEASTNIAGTFNIRKIRDEMLCAAAPYYVFPGGYTERGPIFIR